MTDDEEEKKPMPLPPPFATERHKLRCPHCMFLASARSYAVARATVVEHLIAVHPHGGTQ